jgi:hypothetical protein
VKLENFEDFTRSAQVKKLRPSLWERRGSPKISSFHWRSVN